MSGNELEYELPDAWIWSTMKDVCALITDGTHHSPKIQYSEPAEDRYLYITSKNVRHGGVELGNISYIDADVHKEIYRRCPVEPGDVLLIKDGANTGIATVNQVDEEFSLLSSVALLKPKYGIEPRYLKHYLNSPQGFQSITGKMSGSAIKRIILRRIKQTTLPLPPLPEQRRIVEKIEELLSDLDAGVAALEKAQQQLERYRQSVLKAAVEGRLTASWRAQHGDDTEPTSVLLDRILQERRTAWEADYKAKYEAKGKTPPKGWQSRYKEPEPPDTSDLPELPEGWVWVTVEQTGKVQLGRQRSPKNRSKDYPTKYLRAANITEAGIDITDVLDMEFKPSELERYRLEKGDIVISEASGSPDQVGKPAVWNNQLPICCFQNTVIRLRPHGVSSNYLLASFKHCYVNNVFAKVASGVGINHLSATRFSKIVIPLAPQAEQQEVVDEVEHLHSVADEVEKEIKQELHRAERLRQSILKQAFEGKLVPQDPSDEPASVLLERIKNTKKRKNNMSKNGKPRTSAKTGEQMNLNL